MTRACCAALASCLFAAASCTPGEDDPHRHGGPRAGSGALPGAQLGAIAAEETPLGRAWARVTRIEGSSEGFVVWDASPDGAVLYARRRPAPPGSHERPEHDLRFVGPGVRDASVAIYDGPVLDAAFIGRGRGPTLVAIVDASGALRLGAPGPEAPLVVVDESVAPGLASAPDGSALLYSKGTPPELDIFRLDLGAGDARATARLTDDPAPDWLPAFSEDGARIVFASSRSGVPSLWLADREGRGARALTNAALRPGHPGGLTGIVPAPDGRRPPIWASGAVVFFDGAGVRAVDDRSGGEVWAVPDAREPHALGGGEIAILLPGSTPTFASVGVAGPAGGQP